jgi:hypothetical protein
MCLCIGLKSTPHQYYFTNTLENVKGYESFYRKTVSKISLWLGKHLGQVKYAWELIGLFRKFSGGIECLLIESGSLLIK